METESHMGSHTIREPLGTSGLLSAKRMMGKQVELSIFIVMALVTSTVLALWEVGTVFPWELPCPFLSEVVWDSYLCEESCALCHPLPFCGFPVS